MANIISMGELLIDFTPMGENTDGQLLFARNPGGAPANVAVQAARLGMSAGFFGCVGNDMFGHFLKGTLDSCGVETDGLSLNDEFATTLAFVQLNEKGDRDFSFYRNPGADTRLDFDKIDLNLFKECKLLCFGSLLLTAEPSRTAVEKVVKYARSNNIITAYDPNWRAPLWQDKNEGVERMKSLVRFSDIVKISDEELELLTGESNMRAGADCLLGDGVKIVVVTLGAAGCAVFTKKFNFEMSTYDTKVVDTTGSGDSFFGALLSKIVASGKKVEEISEAEFKDFADFANAAGSTCATKMGAIPALPNVQEIESCINSVDKLVL